MRQSIPINGRYTVVMNRHLVYVHDRQERINLPASDINAEYLALAALQLQRVRVLGETAGGKRGWARLNRNLILARSAPGKTTIYAGRAPHAGHGTDHPLELHKVWDEIMTCFDTERFGHTESNPHD